MWENIDEREKKRENSLHKDIAYISTVVTVLVEEMQEDKFYLHLCHKFG